MAERPPEQGGQARRNREGKHDYTTQLYLSRCAESTQREGARHNCVRG